MTEQSLSPTGDEIDRIAKIIDPDAWHETLPTDGCGQHWHGRRNRARQKARAIATLSPNETWSDNISAAPVACHVLAARFDDSFGEWIYGVVASPPTKPFTHWRMLPIPPGAVSSAVERAARAIVTEISRQTDGRWPHGSNPFEGLVDDVLDFAEIARAALATQPASDKGLREALEPFASFAEHAIDDDGWVGGSGHERICDWFGPSDFRRARTTLETDGGSK